jgi:hypothetical protein
MTKEANDEGQGLGVVSSRNKLRTISAYSMHGRWSNGILDYEHYFEQFFGSVQSQAPSLKMASQIVAVTAAVPDGNGRGAIRFVAGSELDAPSFLNQATGEEQVIETDNGLFVTGVWVYINPQTRMVAIETKRPGVSIFFIERYFEMLGRDFGFSGLHFDLNPSASDAFEDEVKKLETIKRVAVTVSQPNFDWSDDENAIHEYASESGAGSAKIEMSAPRGQGLSVAKGIVHDVLNLSRQAISSLKNVVVTGSAPGEAGDKTINLTRFQKKTSVKVPLGLSPMEELKVVGPAAEQLASEASTELQPIELAAE